MTDPIRIANCSGFFGDRASAAREMVEGGPIDVLTGDWLAELTMLILARRRGRHPRGGFATSFLRQMEEVMGQCLDGGIRVVSNAGGLDPDGCAEGLSEIADRLGLSPAIAYVSGDDLMGDAARLVESGALAPFDDGTIGDPAGYLTANAYLGCWPIVDALDAGADIVVCGRVTDAAVCCGPAAWHHRWSPEDLDQLAGAVVAGHVIECSAQATGGNYSFFTEVEGLERPGFPWVEVASDGSSVVGKHDGTGGEVSVGTVTSQLLYEIGGPRYLGPDVSARFDAIRIEQVATDRVRLSGTVGEAPPPRLKVSINELGGFRNQVAVALTGLDIDEKAALAEAAFWAACPYGPEDYAEVRSWVERTDKADPESNQEATALWRLVVKDPDEEKVGRAFANAMVETALASIPGLWGPGGAPKPGTPFGVFRPGLVDRSEVRPAVTLLGGPAVECARGPVKYGPSDTSIEDSAAEPRGARDLGPTEPAPIGRVVGARSGDKGGSANLGVFTRSEEAWQWLDAFLTTDRLRELLPEVAPLRIDRHRLANLNAVNFVIHELLEEGVAGATRPDAQAKSLGEWLRARVVPIPVSLLGGP